ncbi:MAG: DMT family transporter [Leptospiraceae bacterium]
MEKKDQQANIVLIIGFVLLWNSGFIGAEYGLPFTGPFSLLFFRYLALAVLLAMYLIVTRQLRWSGWKIVWPQMFNGALAHGVWLSCVLIAIDYGVPAGIVALVVALQPLVTGALSGIVTGESTPWNRWMGLFIGFAGVAIPVVLRVNFSDAEEVFAWLIPLGSVIAITVASLFQRRLNLKEDYESMPGGLSLFYQSIATVGTVALPAIFLEGLYVDWNPAFIASMAWLILAVSLGAYSLMWMLIHRMDATRVAALFYLGPPVTMIMAWLAFGDEVQAVDLLGLGLVLIGVMLTYLKYPSRKGS